ncbi:hypothetical protein GEMRC1_013621 [Eukaryota sp. GEM-RC1]
MDPPVSLISEVHVTDPPSNLLESDNFDQLFDTLKSWCHSKGFSIHKYAHKTGISCYFRCRHVYAPKPRSDDVGVGRKRKSTFSNCAFRIYSAFKEEKWQCVVKCNSHCHPLAKDAHSLSQLRVISPEARKALPLLESLNPKKAALTLEKTFLALLFPQRI